IVRIFVSSRRPCDSDAFATSSYGTNFAHPLSAATFVSAAVRVVLPWSMCPIVPTFTCGLDRSNFSLAIEVRLRLSVRCSAGSASRNPAYRVRFAEPRLLRSLDTRDHFLAHVARRLLVAIEMHRVGGAALRARPEVGGVAKHFRERHARIDD